MAKITLDINDDSLLSGSISQEDINKISCNITDISIEKSISVDYETTKIGMSASVKEDVGFEKTLKFLYNQVRYYIEKERQILTNGLAQKWLNKYLAEQKARKSVNDALKKPPTAFE